MESHSAHRKENDHEHEPVAIPQVVDGAVCPLPVQRPVVVSSPDVAGAIIRKAEGADVRAGGAFHLVAMASRGRGGMSHFVMGSVTERVLYHSNLPLLVVRPRRVRRPRNPPGSRKGRPRSRRNRAGLDRFEQERKREVAGASNRGGMYCQGTLTVLKNSRLKGTIVDRHPYQALGPKQQFPGVERNEAHPVRGRCSSNERRISQRLTTSTSSR